MGHNPYGASACLSGSEERKPTLTGSNMQLHQTPTTVVEFQQSPEECLCFSLKNLFCIFILFRSWVGGVGPVWPKITSPAKSPDMYQCMHLPTLQCIVNYPSYFFFFFDCIEHIHKPKSTAVLFLKIKPLYHFFLFPPPLSYFLCEVYIT